MTRLETIKLWARGFEFPLEAFDDRYVKMHMEGTDPSACWWALRQVAIANFTAEYREMNRAMRDENCKREFYQIYHNTNEVLEQKEVIVYES